MTATNQNAHTFANSAHECISYAQSIKWIIAKIVTHQNLCVEQSGYIGDFLDRMKEVITGNEAINHSDLERLINLKGQGNEIAAGLVEVFETSPEKQQSAK